ncbi:MAG: aldolase/citrate lyase family protein [Pseudomonadota bacterium]
MKRFDFLLFHRTLEQSEACRDAGVDGIILDLELHGKEQRQLGFDTEINTHQLDDISSVKTHVGGPVLCRVNGPSPATPQEIDAVLAAGADEVIVPMIRSLQDARLAVDAVAGRARVTLMIETAEALGIVEGLCALPVDRIYVGLNDLQISCGHASIFSPLANTALGRVRTSAGGLSFGFGGLTVPHRGHPLPARHLYGAMARLGCDFSFLRRSFYRDVDAADYQGAVDAMRREMVRAQSRVPAEVESDYLSLKQAVAHMEAAHDAP